MKSMTCRAMGGSCDEMISGATAPEMSDNGKKHVEATHPEILEQMKNMTPEEHATWTTDFTKKFDALAETPAEEPVV